MVSQLIDVVRGFGSVFSRQVCSWVVRLLPGIYFIFLGLGWEWFSRNMSCVPPPLSVGAGLGCRVLHSWHRTHFLCGPSHLPCYCFFSTFCFIVSFHVSLHLPHPPPPVAGDMAMIFR